MDRKGIRKHVARYVCFTFIANRKTDTKNRLIYFSSI